MATWRKVQRRVRDEAGNVVGGPNYEVRVYSNYPAGTLAGLKMRGADAGTTRPNAGFANAGWTAKLTTQLLGTDGVAIVDTTDGIVAGDVFPIIDGLFFHYLVVRSVDSATQITLEQNSNTAGSPTGNHTYPVGAVLNGPGMYGHWQGFVDVVQDYELTVKNLTTGVEGNPDQLFTTQTIGVISFQDEGVSTGSARGTLNVIGGGISIVDNAGSNRVDLTHVDSQSYITTASEATLTGERVLGTTVLTKGTFAARPAASVSGYHYYATDETTTGGPAGVYRDTGAAWEKVALANAIIVDLFTASGTWNKRTGLRGVDVIAFGAGAGGGGGYGNSNSDARGGGGGGGGGAYVRKWFDASVLGATESVGIGAAGGGGAGAGPGAGNAGDGGVGGNTTFGGHMTAFGGGGGNGPTHATGGGGGGGGGSASAGTTSTSTSMETGGLPRMGTGGRNVLSGGGAADTATASGTGAAKAGAPAEFGGAQGGGSPFGLNEDGGAGGSSMFGGGGGGGGGPGDTGNNSHAGGAGGAGGQMTYGSGGGGAGGSAGGAGTAGTSRSGTGKGGDGGGGGANSTGGVGGIGGAGGVPGGGGGGGGVSAASNVGAAGAAGARGELLVINHF